MGDRPSSVRAMLLRKRDEMEADAERWANSFNSECREFCKHTAAEHSDARWHLACVYLDVLAELRERRAQDLTGEDIASLDWCLGFIKMMRGGNDREPFNVHAERAISTLSKLLTRGNR